MARHRALEMFGRSGNPAFKSKAFSHRSSDFSTNEVMTLSGAVNKTGLYLLLCNLCSSLSSNILFLVSLILGFLVLRLDHLLTTCILLGIFYPISFSCCNSKSTWSSFLSNSH